MQKHADEFAQRGARLLAIGQGSGAEATAMAEKLGLDFPCLGDPGHEGYQALGLGRSGWWGLLGAPFFEDPKGAFRNLRQADLAASANPRSNVKQLGGVLIVGRGGKVEYLYRSASTTDLPETAELLAVLDGAGA